MYEAYLIVYNGSPNFMSWINFHKYRNKSTDLIAIVSSSKELF